MKITDELLLENGYKEYQSPNIYTGMNRFFQKRFRNEKGQTMYFINFYECKSYKGYEVDLQFEKERYIINMLIFGIDGNMTLEEIEQEVYSIWYGLDCKYYDYEEEWENGR